MHLLRKKSLTKRTAFLEAERVELEAKNKELAAVITQHEWHLDRFKERLDAVVRERDEAAAKAALLERQLGKIKAALDEALDED